MSSGSSHGSLSSRCSLSASSRGSLNSLTQSISNPDGLHLSNSNEYFPSSYHLISTTCPPIYEATKLEASSYGCPPFPSPIVTLNTCQQKGSLSSRDSLSVSSASPPVSPMTGEKGNEGLQWPRGYSSGIYTSVQSRAENSQYMDTNGVDRTQPCSQVNRNN